MEFGPNKDEERFQQVKKSQDKMLAKPYTQVPIFLALAPDMVYQLETFGGVNPPREKASMLQDMFR